MTKLHDCLLNAIEEARACFNTARILNANHWEEQGRIKKLDSLSTFHWRTANALSIREEQFN